MTEERKQELEQLLGEAMANLVIRSSSGDRSSLLPVAVYRKHLRRYWTSYSEDALWTVRSFDPHIVSEVTKSKLLDFIRTEFAPFIREDRILSASFFLIGGPGNGFPLESLLKQLLQIAIARGIMGAISAFDRCTEDTHGSVQYMALLEGIKLKTKIQIFEGIRLVPLPSSTSELPHYLPRVSHHMPEHSFFGKTVLIIDCSVSPIFHKPFPPATTMQEYEELEKYTFRVGLNSEDFPNCEVEDFPLLLLCQALSFACSSSVQIALIWKFLAGDELYNLNFGIGGGFSMSLGPFGRSTEVGEAEINEAKRLYHLLVKLNSNVREKLRIPIDRWIKSKTDENPVDKMIDLGIAFEALYVPDSDGEITFKLAARASWHLGTDRECRKKLLAEFKEIYNWRSKAVHTGSLPTKKKKKRFTYEDIERFIARAQNLCRQSILKILEAGEFPEWNDLILG